MSIRKEPVGFLDPGLIPWEPEGGIQGLYAKTLSRCSESGSYTRLLKFLPGTDTSPLGPQSHDHLEELWLVSGALHDLTLDQTFVAGMYANRLYHMDHGPWRAPTGAVTYELRDLDPHGQITKPQLEFIDPDLLAWDPVDGSHGLFTKTLTHCRDTESYGRLVGFHPGGQGSKASDPQLQRSEIWVVSGELIGIRDDSVHPAGTYGNLDIDLLDENWTSPHGCVVFEVRNLI